MITRTDLSNPSAYGSDQLLLVAVWWGECVDEVGLGADHDGQLGRADDYQAVIHSCGHGAVGDQLRRHRRGHRVPRSWVECQHVVGSVVGREDVARHPAGQDQLVALCPCPAVPVRLVGGDQPGRNCYRCWPAVVSDDRSGGCAGEHL